MFSPRLLLIDALGGTNDEHLIGANGVAPDLIEPLKGFDVRFVFVGNRPQRLTRADFVSDCALFRFARLRGGGRVDGQATERDEHHHQAQYPADESMKMSRRVFHHGGQNLVQTGRKDQWWILTE